MKNKYLTYFKKMYLSDDSVQYVLRVYGITIWCSLHTKYCSWFRLLGVGFLWKRFKYGLTFSERNGYKKYIHIGKWVIEFIH